MTTLRQSAGSPPNVEAEDEDQSESSTSNKEPWLFLTMTRFPYPFLVCMPFLFILLICLGLSRPNIIEEDVSNLWIPTDGSYKQDKDYAKSVGAAEDEMSTFMAMALSRHGDNLFSEDNLNAIVERMQRIENSTVTYNGNEYTWNDICLANGLSQETTYQMPCLRLSPMDLFEEARWYFTEEQRVTWYQEVRGKVVKPLLIKYGIAVEKCLSANLEGNPNSDNNDNPSENDAACDHAYRLRTDSVYAVSQGYPQDHADGVTSLLQDLYSLPLNDPCQICIHDNTEPHLQELKDDYVIPAFTTLSQQLRRFLFDLEEQEDVRMDTLRYVESLIKGTAAIASQVTSEEVEDFYMYYTLRSLYAEGAAEYQEMYREVNDPFYRSILCGNKDLVCPPEDVTLEEARETLLRHADNSFSSTVSFGAPFPFWGSADGTGHLFAGNFPVSGSGINMSAPFVSLKTYLDLENRQSSDWRPFFYDERREEGFVDPLGSDYFWETMVESNPVYAWFMSGEETMTAHCGNGYLLGTDASDIMIDSASEALVKSYSQLLCTNYTLPFEEDATETRQHFARMWYDMVIDSPFVLDIIQGESDPYSWTSGAGCGYDMGYSRFSYTGESEDTILQNASTFLYNIDEGAEIGVVDPTPLIGDVYPPIGEYSFDNPLQHVGLLQTVYVTLVGKGIAERVRHKNRPGGPLDITEEDAVNILSLFKKSFESFWTEGWDDDDSGEVQFVGFFDDVGSIGTLGTFLNSVTMSSGLLTAISILIIMVFSVIFLASRDPVKSRIGITLVGVVLVILAFFASVGLGILVGIRVNLTIAWTLPFVILGLGVNNLYIILLSMQKQGGYTKECFFKGMEEVIVPITMTSLVNCSMFLVMQINSIPAVYLTAQVALFSIIFLYLAVVLCFPAYTFFDMQRQKANRKDVLVWMKVETNEDSQHVEKHCLEVLLYDRCYRPLLFGAPFIRIITHSLIWACAALLLALGLYGISLSTVGLGLEDFLPPDHQGHLWASARSDVLGAWNVNMNWPDVDYSSSDVQLRMIKQFESVIDTPHIVDIDTRMLWIAEFGLWTSRLCDYNLAPGDRKCGRDQLFEDEDSICEGIWKINTYGLREQYLSESDDQCQPYDGGICRFTSQLHPDDVVALNISATGDNETSWCPVFEGWSPAKMEFCIRTFHEIVGSTGGLVLDPEADCNGELCEDHMVKFPIPYSAGPTMTAKDVISHEQTLQMMEQTRRVCDEDPDLHCWMSGPPFDFWSQYEGIEDNLIEIAGASVFIGFGISLVFFVLKLFHDGQHSAYKIFLGSLVGATLIAGNCLFCLVAVVGLSILSGVSLTAFSIMSFVLSVGFAVEYSVHIIARWLQSDRDTALERVEDTMSFLMLPTFMSFGSSMLGVLCLSMTEFEFNTRFFFRPLVIVMFVTYFFGCLVLPSFLSILDFDFIKLGPKTKQFSKKTVHDSKLQQSESSEEADPSSDDVVGGVDSDIESTPAPPMSNCMLSALDITESTSFNELFPRPYKRADSGGAQDDSAEGAPSSKKDVDDNSVLSEMPPPAQVMAARQASHTTPPAEERAASNVYQMPSPATDMTSHRVSPPAQEIASRQALDSICKDASSISSNNSLSAPSVDSSALTLEVDNTLKNLLLRTPKKPAQESLLPPLDADRQSPERETDGESLVDTILRKSASSTEEIGTLYQIARSESSNAFDGIFESSCSQDEMEQSSTKSHSSIVVLDPIMPAAAPPASTVDDTDREATTCGPVTLKTIARGTFDEMDGPGPVSSGGLFRKLEAHQCFPDNDGRPSASRQSFSNPKQKRFPTNPFGANKTAARREEHTGALGGANESLNTSKDELLSSQANNDPTSRCYDFDTVIEEENEEFLDAIEPSPGSPPNKSNRSIVTAGLGTGEVLSVNPVDPQLEDKDTHHTHHL